jgi:hypothetical protein
LNRAEVVVEPAKAGDRRRGEAARVLIGVDVFEPARLNQPVDPLESDRVNLRVEGVTEPAAAQVERHVSVLGAVFGDVLEDGGLDGVKEAADLDLRLRPRPRAAQATARS